MTIAELFLSVAILAAGITTGRLVTGFYRARGQPERLSRCGGAAVGLIVSILALVLTAPAPRPTRETQVAAHDVAEPVDSAVSAVKEVVFAADTMPIMEPAVAMAAEPLAAAPPPAPTTVPQSSREAEDPARLAHCAALATRGSIAARAERKFGRASDRLEPGEELLVAAATAVTMRLDDAQRRRAPRSDGAPETLAPGTRLKIHQRFGRPGEWVWYQIHLPGADAWRYTTSRALDWVNRSPRGQEHERAKRRWIDAEVAKARDPRLDERAAREQWHCDDARRTHRS